MILGFGEIMLRLKPRGALRFRQALPGDLEATFGGGEANVCASLAMLGDEARYISALPRNPITESLVAQLRGLGVDTSFVRFAPKGRLGIYFLEAGANQRSSTVVYDRDETAIALTEPGDYPFDEALEGVRWVHVTGITPSLSHAAYASTLALVKKACERGADVSCDLNFRKKLWRWREGVAAKELARECMSAILPHCGTVIANEEDAHDVLGIRARGSDVESGRIDAAAYADVARAIVAGFPNVKRVAITLRESYSADHNNWGGMLYDAAQDRAFFAPLAPDGSYRPYEMRDIVDRVGGGDSFGAGLIHALNHPEWAEPQQAIRFAVAASCLKHTIVGDFNYVSESEARALMEGSGSGRVRR